MASNNFPSFNQNGVVTNTPNPPLVCRVCSQAFPNVQAFISHTEIHVDQDNLSRGRRSFSPNLINSQSQVIPNFPRPSSVQENRVIRRANSAVTPRARANQYPYNTTARVGMSQPMIRPTPIPPEIFPSSAQSYRELARLVTRPIYPQEAEMEISPIDGTKALINKLDIPIRNNSIIDILDMNPEIFALDLDLKL